MKSKDFYRMQIHQLVDTMDNDVLLCRFYTILKYSTEKPEA